MTPRTIPYHYVAAWDPLLPASFDPAAAAHLLRRTGIAAIPSEIEQAVDEGLEATLDRLFPKEGSLQPRESMLKLRQEWRAFYRGRNSFSETERREKVQDLRNRSNEVEDEMMLEWALRLRDPASAATERWVIFLFNVWVVSVRDLGNDNLSVFDHIETLRQNRLGPYPELCKAASRTAAMIRYLNLNENSKKKPNENFARELMELFVLGEGNYTEADIKEAARAFTGYRNWKGDFQFAAAHHDGGVKTVFGQSGPFNGDDIIDLLFEQPAARTFLPGEMVRHYVTSDGLPSEMLVVLGDRWAKQEFRLDALLRMVFSSSVFFDPRYRGNMIKTPVQLLFGSLHELGLAVNPSRRYLRNQLRVMGQDLLAPPNVRGWVGGRDWISGATLSARRQTVTEWFKPIDLERMNADEKRAFEAVMERVDSPFRVDRALLERFATASGDDLVPALLRRFLATPVEGQFRAILEESLSEPSPANARKVILTLLQTPSYQLC